MCCFAFLPQRDIQSKVGRKAYKFFKEIDDCFKTLFFMPCFVLACTET